MIIHGASLSPFVRKVGVFANEKGIIFDHVMGPPGGKDPAFLAISPFGKIPGFEDGDYTLSDSSAIVHYLEAKQPEPNLIPTEAKARGRTIWYEEIADTVLIAQMGAIFFNRVVAKMMGMEPNLAAADKAEQETLPPFLDWLEGQIPASGFLVEDRLTLADIAMVCPLKNLEYAGTVIDAVKYQKVTNYTAAILGRPSFAALLAMDAKMLGR